MTEEEILAELAIINQTIKDILQAGEEYETQAVGSRRRTRFSSLDELKKQRSYLLQDLESVRGNSGVVTQF
jgi:hypothetical protein